MELYLTMWSLVNVLIDSKQSCYDFKYNNLILFIHCFYFWAMVVYNFLKLQHCVVLKRLKKLSYLVSSSLRHILMWSWHLILSVSQTQREFLMVSQEYIISSEVFFLCHRE